MSTAAISINPLIQNLSQNKEFIDSLIQNLSQNKEFICSLTQNKGFIDSLSQNEDFKGFLKGFTITLLKEDQEYREYIRNFIDCSITTSELNILKRLSAVEQVLGLDDLEEEEGHEPTIPEKIIKLEEQLEKVTLTVKPDILNRELVNAPQSLTDLRTDFLIEHMETNDLVPKISTGFVNLEARYVDSKEFKYFVKHVLPPEYRPKSIKNLRKMKKDLFENARCRHGDKVSIDKSFHGNKELRLVITREIPISAFSNNSPESVTMCN
jgi:hypothetical protein